MRAALRQHTSAECARAAFESFRTLAGWLAGSIVVPAGWAPTLNYKDPVFGSSQGFYDAFKQARTFRSERRV